MSGEKPALILTEILLLPEHEQLDVILCALMALVHRQEMLQRDRK